MDILPPAEQTRALMDFHRRVDICLAISVAAGAITSGCIALHNVLTGNGDITQNTVLGAAAIALGAVAGRFGEGAKRKQIALNELSQPLGNEA